MKNKLSFLLSVVCLWGVILVSGCSEKDETPTNLTLKEGTQTTQVVYADEVTNQGGISFTALSDWTATVTEVATEASTKAASGNVECGSWFVSLCRWILLFLCGDVNR